MFKGIQYFYGAQRQTSDCPDPAVVQIDHLLENKFSVAEVFLMASFHSPCQEQRFLLSMFLTREQFEPSSLF